MGGLQFWRDRIYRPARTGRLTTTPGRALEPTIGSGNFLGLQPADLSEQTEWFAAELDLVTGKIAKHL